MGHVEAAGTMSRRHDWRLCGKDPGHEIWILWPLRIFVDYYLTFTEVVSM